MLTKSKFFRILVNYRVGKLHKIFVIFFKQKLILLRFFSKSYTMNITNF